jgi:hypothetical protein
MDAHNLAVKIALVESGVAKPEIPLTYGLEHRQVATHLAQMDADLIQIYADHGKSDDPEDIKKLVAFQAEHLRSRQAQTSRTRLIAWWTMCRMRGPTWQGLSAGRA